jgi:3'-phosphoadenosine 5'-phosphosulfate sulfotransferase (PAPS reductase)/FAD synthetase
VRRLAEQAQAQRLIDAGAHFYVGHSGGKDSWAQYAALRAIVPAEQLHVVHADLGDVEHAGILDLIKSGLDPEHQLHIARAIHADGSRKTFFSAVRQRRAALDAKGQFDAPAFPSSAARFCTSDLKTGPIWKVIRQHAATHGVSIVVNCVGIRGAESPSRAKRIASRGTLNANAKNTTKTRSAYDWWPIAHWSDAEVWAIIDEQQMPVHAAYRAGNDRLSCQFCIFGSRCDLRNAAQSNPELLARYTALEAEVRSTMFNGESLAQRITSSQTATGGNS